MRSIATGMGLLMAVLVGAAVPAAAHNETPAPPPVVMDGAPLAGAATAGPEPAKSTAVGTGAGLAGAAAVTLLGMAALTAVRRRARRGNRMAAAALVFAGAAHVALAPSHWAEGRHLGVFFALSGALLLGQGVVVGLRPSPAAYASVLASTTVLLVLYFLAREVVLPLVDHRDPYLLADVPVKVAEAVAALAAGAGLAAGSSRRALRPVLSA